MDPQGYLQLMGGGAEDEAGKEAGQTPKAPIGLFVNQWDLRASSQGGGPGPCLIQWDLRCHPKSYHLWAQALESLRPGSKHWSYLLLTPSPDSPSARQGNKSSLAEGRCCWRCLGRASPGTQQGLVNRWLPVHRVRDSRAEWLRPGALGPACPDSKPGYTA